MAFGDYLGIILEFFLLQRGIKRLLFVGDCLFFVEDGQADKVGV